MTQTQEIILHTVLEFLLQNQKPQSEPMIHSAAQTELGTTITVDDLNAVLKHANEKRLAIGLTGAERQDCVGPSATQAAITSRINEDTFRF
jgi:hypothetical protein